MKSTDEIKRHLRHGDYARIGKLAGVSSNYAIKLMDRESASKHKKVVQAARKIANVNKRLGL